MGYPSIQEYDIVMKLAPLHQPTHSHVTTLKKQNVTESKIVVQATAPSVELHGKNCRNDMVLLLRQPILLYLFYFMNNGSSCFNWYPPIP